MKTITEKLESVKRTIAKTGVEYWRARDVMPMLGYSTWRSFEEALTRAMCAFDAAGEKTRDHFADARKMVVIGSGAMRERGDYYLTRAACYILAMNSDSRKLEVAEAQEYFAVQTRRMEKIEKAALEFRRVDIRERVEEHNRMLGRTAKDVGVKRFGLFHWAGIKGMYAMPLQALKEKRGLKEKDKWLDHAGIEELAANDFRITQTDAKIKREDVKGEDAAIRTHETVGQRVRQTIRSLGNVMPEDLPVEPPIQEIKKRLKTSETKSLPKN